MCVISGVPCYGDDLKHIVGEFLKSNPRRELIDGKRTRGEPIGFGVALYRPKIYIDFRYIG